MNDDPSSSSTGQPAEADHLLIHIDIENDAPGLWGPAEDWQSTISTPLRAAAISETCNHANSELSILLTDDTSIQTLNRDYRGKDKPTNVLSFPAMEADEVAAIAHGTNGAMPIMFGDIALAYETIQKEANIQKKSFHDHLNHLVIHGFLHLIGYDHIEDDEAEIMESRERQILRKLGIADPYRINAGAEHESEYNG